MQADERRQCQNRHFPAATGVRRGFEAVVPNPKLKLMDQVSEVMRCSWLRVEG